MSINVSSIDDVPEEDRMKVIEKAKEALGGGFKIAVKLVSACWEGDCSIVCQIRVGGITPNKNYGFLFIDPNDLIP